MKMIICIVQDTDKEQVTKALNERGYRATVLPSTGAFFRRGNSTMLIGVEKEKVDDAIQVIKSSIGETDDPNVKRVTLFVINVDNYTQV
jgi:uncharacterized protein YaaQ